jgi:hypothetical protein
LDIAQALEERRFHDISEAIDTGLDHPETSRALIVFNTSGEPLVGLLVFHVEMPWRVGHDLPPLQATNLASQRVCRHRILNLIFVPPPHDEDRGLLHFDLWIEVEGVAPRGWETLIVEYVSRSGEEQTDAVIPLPLDPDRYVIVETLRHGGDLPSRWPAQGDQ